MSLCWLCAIAASTTAPIIKRAKPPGANPNTAFRMYHGMVESQVCVREPAHPPSPEGDRHPYRRHAD